MDEAGRERGTSSSPDHARAVAGGMLYRCTRGGARARIRHITAAGSSERSLPTTPSLSSFLSPILAANNGPKRLLLFSTKLQAWRVHATCGSGWRRNTTHFSHFTPGRSSPNRKSHVEAGASLHRSIPHTRAQPDVALRRRRLPGARARSARLSTATAQASSRHTRSYSHAAHTASQAHRRLHPA